MTILERVMRDSIPEPNSGCILWLGYINESGYGRLTLRRKRGLVHRLLYEEVVGKVPEGRCLDHLCRVRSCVNVQHLEVVTPTENTRRGTGFAAVNRKKDRCGVCGSPFTLAIRRQGFVERACRECARLRCAKYNEKKRKERTHGL